MNIINKKNKNEIKLEGFGLCHFCRIENRPMRNGEIVKSKKGRAFKCGVCLKKDK